MDSKNYFEALPIEKLYEFFKEHFMNVLPKTLAEFKKCVFKNRFHHRLNVEPHFIEVHFDNVSCKVFGDGWLKRGVSHEKLDMDYKLMMAEYFKDDPKYVELLEQHFENEKNKKIQKIDKQIEEYQKEIEEKQRQIEKLKHERENISIL